MPSKHAGNTISNRSLEKLLSTKMQSMKHMDLSEPFLAQDKMVHVNLQNNNKEALREAPHPFTLMNQVDQKRGRFEPEIKVLHVLEEHRNNISARHYENSLFSSSLSDLFSRKNAVRLSSYNDICGHSIGNADPRYQEEPLESLEEIEAQTIGNLLPDDDDLLAGVTDGLDINVLSGSCDEIEDTDLFSNIGGMDLEEDISSTEQYFGKGFTTLNGLSSAEHIYGELPSRTLLVRNINSNFKDFELQSLLELYGEIHTLDTTCKNRGAVMITYYDLRSACNAMKELQSKSLKHLKLEIHFYSLKDKIYGTDINQGVVAVYNLESSISNDELRSIFGIYGEIKEIRDNTQPNPRKFIEFYDIRAANAALNALNSFDSMGKEIKIELPHPGGARSLTQNHSTGVDHEVFKNLISSSVNSERAESVPLGTIGSRTNGNSMGAHTSFRAPIGHFGESSFHLGVSNSVPKSLPSLVGVESFGTQQQACPMLCHSPAHIKFEYQGGPELYPHSLPNEHDIFPFNNSGNMAASLPGSGGRIMNRQLIGLTLTTNSVPMEMNGIGSGNRVHPGSRYSWNNSPNPHHASMVLPNSPSVANGFQPQQRLHRLPRAPNILPNRVVPVTSHHVGSAPAINPSLWEMQHAFSGESVEGSSIHPDSFGNLRISNSSSGSMDFVPRNVFPHTGGSFHGSPIQSRGMGFNSHQQRCVMFSSRSPMGGMMNSFDSSNETIRFCRNENVSSQTENKKLFELDIDRILQGDDSRSTLMIKNIPNKYTSKMLLAAIDERHKGTYDFIYLPIDFKNKCNVGYAFINMTEPKSIVPFYQAFNGKKWEKFNSEKVASIAYARIQGKAALVAHFQNSSLMNEDKRCRPILFNTDGPNAGDQVPFPMGINIRPRMGKTRTSISNADQGSAPSLATGERFCASDSSSGSARDSD